MSAPRSTPYPSPVDVLQGLPNRLRSYRGLLAPLCFFAVLYVPAALAEPQDYDLAFSTLLGGNGEEWARDIAIDLDGNVYVTGGTSATDFPLIGVPGPISNNTPSPLAHQSAMDMDIFVTKFSPAGDVIWSQTIGGPNYDRAYAIEVDEQGQEDPAIWRAAEV